MRCLGGFITSLSQAFSYSSSNFKIVFFLLIKIMIIKIIFARQKNARPGRSEPACAESFWLITDWHKGPGLLLLLHHHHLHDGHIGGDYHHHGNDVCTCLCVLFCSQSPGRYITVTVSLYCWHLDNPATSSHTYNACHTSPNTYFDICPYTEHTQTKMLLKLFLIKSNVYVFST